MREKGDYGGRLRERPRRRRRTVRLSTGLLSVMFAVFVAGGLYFGYIFVTTAVSLLSGTPRPAVGSLLPANPFQSGTKGTPQPGEPALTLPDWHGTDRLNVLLLGIDQREDERGEPTRTDTMIILTIDPVTKSAIMVHVPRDLWVVVPGHGENKINTAHFFGEMDRPGSGPALAKRTIEITFGVRMHYYARVDFSGFEKLIDTIGGVTVDAPKPIKDDEYPEGDYGIRRVYIPSGPQRMDGRVALQYARSRHADNDLGRGQRQQQVLVGAKKEAMQLDLLPKLPSLLGVVRDAVTTDIPATDMLGLVNLARQIDSKNIETRAIDISMVNDLYGDGTVLMPRWEVIRPMMAEVFSDPQLRAERAKIVVQNGTTRDGLAASVGAALTGRGYTVKGVSSAARSDYRETVIIDHTGKKNTVQKLADLLNVAKRNVRSEPGRDEDITIVLGTDAKVPN